MQTVPAAYPRDKLDMYFFGTQRFSAIHQITTRDHRRVLAQRVEVVCGLKAFRLPKTTCNYHIIAHFITCLGERSVEYIGNSSRGVEFCKQPPGVSLFGLEKLFLGLFGLEKRGLFSYVQGCNDVDFNKLANLQNFKLTKLFKLCFALQRLHWFVALFCA